MVLSLNNFIAFSAGDGCVFCSHRSGEPKVLEIPYTSKLFVFLFSNLIELARRHILVVQRLSLPQSEKLTLIIICPTIRSDSLRRCGPTTPPSNRAIMPHLLYGCLE